MATKTIPQLPASAAALLTMLFEVDNAGVSEKLTLTQIKTLLSASGGLMPTGTILMWSGTIATIPAGFVLCNGAAGTPDLRNRFIVGADADNAGVAKTTVSGPPTIAGGAINATPSISYNSIIVADNNGLNSVDVPDGDAGVSSNTISLLNPYFALAYIMKT